MNGQRLAELEKKFNNSGLKCHPIITDEELGEMKSAYAEMCDYFIWINEIIIYNGIHSRRCSVESVINARNS